jgi:UPF0271 protein
MNNGLPTMKWIDLNADIGEGFECDFELLDVVSSVNICSGFHAGSPKLCQELLTEARTRGIRAGLHVGFPDPGSMGRRQLAEGYPETWISSVAVQIMSAGGFAYIKPHGALYHWLAIDTVSTRTVWDALEEMEKPLMGMEGTEHEFQARRRGLRLIREGFAERGYDQFGGLLPRGTVGAELTDLAEIKSQALRLAPAVDSICIHGDRSDALNVARAVRTALEGSGIGVAA